MSSKARAAKVQRVAKKKTGEEAAPSTLVRVSTRFAGLLRRASIHEDKTMITFVDEHLLPIVEQRYNEAVLKEAKRIERNN
jgi:enterochelin esterase-like enzyme